MNVVIIEDEPNAAAELAAMIAEVIPSALLVAQPDSVKAASQWFNTHAAPDLVFMDIHLGDGIAFQVFELTRIECPVIFCTAFDSYLLEAFKKNGIGYIVKPTTRSQVKSALENFTRLRSHFTLAHLKQLSAAYEPNYKTSYLVHFKTKMLPITVENILFFYLKNEMTYLVTRDGEYPVHKSLELVEQENDPKQFYRVNRQYLVAHRHVKDIEQADGRKLEIGMRASAQRILVSKERAVAFRIWMDQR